MLVNTTLKKDRSQSHTQLLLDVVAVIFARVGAGVDQIHLLSHVVPPGVQPDMTAQGWDRDDDGNRAVFDNDFTQRNATIMSWNLLHLARQLRDSGGLPSHGNDRNAWAAGCRFEHENPEHRR